VSCGAASKETNMDEYSDIYFDDARNATRDHRAHGVIYRPAPRPTRTPVVQQPAPASSYRPVYPPQVPAYPPQVPVYYAQQPILWGEPTSTAGALLGRLTITQIIEIAAQAFAALQSLPPAPNPERDTETNTANMILYQTALAQHAKRDEQIRTLGSLVAKLAG
jgi:hypothetical protein